MYNLKVQQGWSMWPSHICFFSCLYITVMAEKITDQQQKMMSSHYITSLAPCSCFYRGIPSLESLHKVFGWGLSGDGPYYRVQQGAAEQSEQPAQTAGPARDGGRPTANTVGHQQNGTLMIYHLCLTEISLTHMYLHFSDHTLSFWLLWSPIDSTLCSSIDISL